jgi:antitoxin CcdA
MTKTVAVRLDEELKRKAKFYNVNISEVVRSALRDEIARRERSALISSLEQAKRALSRVPDEEIIKAVREARDSR